MEIVSRLAEYLIKINRTICVAESCTGGLIAKLCTDLAGSSAWFERGFVTYSNQAKTDLLRVKSIEKHGAVSEQTVSEMASGALNNSRADFCVAVSGIAGPGGGSKTKPVGTVWFAFASPARIMAVSRLFGGNRMEIREQSARFALTEMLNFIGQEIKSGINEIC